MQAQNINLPFANIFGRLQIWRGGNEFFPAFTYIGGEVGMMQAKKLRGEWFRYVRVPEFKWAASQTNFETSLNVTRCLCAVVHSVFVLQLQMKYHQIIYFNSQVAF